VGKRGSECLEPVFVTVPTTQPVNKFSIMLKYVDIFYKNTMGIMRKIADILEAESDGDNSPPSAGRKRKSQGYRDAPFTVPIDATREDLARVLEDLVKNGKVQRESVEDSLEGIVDSTREKIKVAAEVGKLLNETEKEKLLKTVKARFEEHSRNPEWKKLQEWRKDVEWAKVQAKLEANPEKMWSLNEMERTGGEPDVVGYDKKTGEYIFWDLSKESPSGRRDLCYDAEGEAKHREENREYIAKGNAVEMARNMGIDILDKEEYRELQVMGKFDEKESNWLKPPSKISKAGFALCGRRVHGNVRVFQHDAHDRDDRRGFRGSLKV